MSDNQSWNSSGSDEDVETSESGVGQPVVGVAELGGIISKVTLTSKLVLGSLPLFIRYKN